jgi:hypothetical protein
MSDEQAEEIKRLSLSLGNALNLIEKLRGQIATLETALAEARGQLQTQGQPHGRP